MAKDSGWRTLVFSEAAREAGNTGRFKDALVPGDDGQPTKVPLTHIFDGRPEDVAEQIAAECPGDAKVVWSGPAHHIKTLGLNR